MAYPPQVDITFDGFQRDLVEAFTELLADIESFNAKGKKVTGVRCFAQELPVIRQKEEAPFPCMLVRIYDAETDEQENIDFWIVTVELHIGVYEPGEKRQGHRKVLEIIQCIVDRLCENRRFGKRGYTALQDMSWTVQESDERMTDIFYGGVAVRFWVPKRRRESKYC